MGRAERAAGRSYDPKHNRYFELTFAAGAEVNVSPDEDLLALAPWREIWILWSRYFFSVWGQ